MQQAPGLVVLQVLEPQACSRCLLRGSSDEVTRYALLCLVYLVCR
jgi:hypothetical protein